MGTSKTGGGVGTNQYAVKGVSQAQLGSCAGMAADPDDLSMESSYDKPMNACEQQMASTVAYHARHIEYLLKDNQCDDDYEDGEQADEDDEDREQTDEDEWDDDGDYGSRTAKFLEENVLDVDIVCGFDKQYKRAELTLGVGGPAVTFDTRTGEIKATWTGCQPQSAWVTRDAANHLDDYLGQLWEDMG